MMKRMMTTWSCLALAACAGAPKNKGSEPEAIKPTYNEKPVSTVHTEAWSNSVPCPRDSSYEKKDWLVMVAAANACVKAKDWEKVEKVAETLAIKAPLTPWGAYFLSLAAEVRGDQPRALWMIDLALKKAPREGLFHYQKGRLSWKFGESLAAVEALKEAAQLNPGLTDAHLVLAQIHMQKDELKEARRSLELALASDAKHGPSLLAASSLEMKSKDFAKAEGYLVQAIEVYPRQARLRETLASIQESQLKKNNEALQSYRALRSLLVQHKLDDMVSINVDEKIQALEKKLAQAGQNGPVTSRQPTAERRVQK